MSDSKKESCARSSARIYLRLLGYARPFWIPFAISILGFVIFASRQPAMAWMLKYFVDGLPECSIAKYLGVPLMCGITLFFILVALYQGIGSYLVNYFIAKVSLGVVHDLRTALFDNLLTLPNRYFDNNNSGHLVSRVTFNVTMVTGAATDAIKVVFREGLTVIFLFGYL